LNPDEVALNGV